MDEITRQEYLDSMGIQSYFPRYDLPAAKQSDQCPWPDSLIVETSVKLNLDKTINEEPLASPSIKAVITETSPDKPELAVTEKAVNKSDAEEVRFKLALIHIKDDALALVLLPYIHTSKALSLTQKQLFTNIFNALYKGGVELNVEIKPFSWPFSEALHVEKDAKAAKASLGAYLEQLKGQFSFRRFIVMGEKIAPFVEVGDNYKMIVCRSLDEMLKMPQLKREVWQHLKKSI